MPMAPRYWRFPRIARSPANASPQRRASQEAALTRDTVVTSPFGNGAVRRGSCSTCAADNWAVVKQDQVSAREKRRVDADGDRRSRRALRGVADGAAQARDLGIGLVDVRVEDDLTGRARVLWTADLDEATSFKLADSAHAAIQGLSPRGGLYRIVKVLT